MIGCNRKSWRAVCGTLVLATALSGCSALSGMNPFGGDDDFLPGDRQPLYSSQTINAENVSASIGPATGGSAWPQPAGPADNDPGNIAVDVTGSVAWNKSIGKPRGGGFLSVGSPPRNAARPVSDGSRIYVYKQDGDLVALSMNGGSAFTRSLRPEGESEVGIGGGVALDNGKIFVATAYRQLHALDGAGQILWTKDLDIPVRGAPTAAGGHVIIVTQENEVMGISQEDGSQSWSFTGISENAGLLASSSAAVSGNTVVVPFSSGEVMALDVKSGEPKWIDAVARSFRTRALSGLSDVSASPVIHDGRVFATSISGRTIAVSLRDGERFWEADIGSVHTPVASGSALFMIGLDDNLYALDNKSGRVLWAADLSAGDDDAGNWAGPILANGKLIAMSSEGNFVQVDAKTGAVLASKKTSEDVFVTPIVAGGRMIVLSGDGSVAALN
ncbi:PQQ-binding-like beta-propeller repeat protein [Pseudovibrio sp. SPO723]|uniref:outer membrane protein assembly factor BamB family protein n=1 Tax=Nesiotobacter zosterae TaxID=392721 RepID=UPI0029C29BDF|nr:PQQ-binding-like beta-propeller repeat protein [Pseudovibrio sp. SPO723]MDX5593753.1 PQQ-binding-like beta-propeller repeat protein [Pseudovibrio sp. SPO723]